MLTGCSCFIQTLLIVSVSNSTPTLPPPPSPFFSSCMWALLRYVSVSGSSPRSPFVCSCNVLVSMPLPVTLCLCLSHLISVHYLCVCVCACVCRGGIQRSGTECQQVISCRRPRTLCVCVRARFRGRNSRGLFIRVALKR